jgi:hypothetical protein
MVPAMTARDAMIATVRADATTHLVGGPTIGPVDEGPRLPGAPALEVARATGTTADEPSAAGTIGPATVAGRTGAATTVVALG